MSDERPPDNPPDGPEWKPWLRPGFPGYEGSHRGHVRSVDRKAGMRNVKGKVLTERPHNRGYLQVDVRDENGKQHTIPVQHIVLESHDQLRPPGHEAAHAKDNPTDNRYPESLSWVTEKRNREMRQENTPPKPEKPKPGCVRCDRPFEGNGRRCHPCVVDIGKQAAKLLRSGVKLDEALAKRLDYPSVEGLHTLARRYGHYGQSWSQRVKTKAATLSDRLPVHRRPTRGRKPVTSANNRKSAPKGPKSVSGLPVEPRTNGTKVSPPAPLRPPPVVTERKHVPYPDELVQDRTTRRNRTRSR